MIWDRREGEERARKGWEETRRCQVGTRREGEGQGWVWKGSSGEKYERISMLFKGWKVTTDGSHHSVYICQCI